MFFIIITWKEDISNSPNQTVYLRRDNWDDFGYKTQFYLEYKDSEGNPHDIGVVKIGEFFGELGVFPYSPNLPTSFDSLSERFYSIGQNESYYENLDSLGSTVRDNILLGLKDLAKDPKPLERALQQDMMTKSLMRNVGLQTIKNRFHRLANGDIRLTQYKFSYSAPYENAISQFNLSFEVIPYSEPPTNIHVLIGRNGVGKTFLLTKMMLSMVLKKHHVNSYGIISADNSNEDAGLFANIISISFSAFDAFDLLPVPDPEHDVIKFSYVGLRQVDDGKHKWSEIPKHIQILTTEFVNCVEFCLLNGKLKHLERAIKILSSDPMFESIDLINLINQGEELSKSKKNKCSSNNKSAVLWYENLTILFNSLSSGHKIVLLTIAQLVKGVVERTLVLIDEPEAHLHPPLLSAFIRSLSDLLIQQNGVAIIATHSPVVVQEVPKNCVWKLRRSGTITKAERPREETFGENVGVLTRDIFGLEVTQSGFHNMLQDAVNQNADFDSVMAHFKNQLGAEARAIVQGLILDKQIDNSDI